MAILEYPLGRKARARLVWQDDDKTLIIRIDREDGITRPADKRMVVALKNFLQEMR